MSDIVRIFTDGSAIGNPGPGGWGAILIRGSQRRELCGAFCWTTISEMELVAAVEALRLVPSGARVELYSDSELLIHGMRGFVSQWRDRGWKNRRGLALQHRDLWMQLIDLDTLRIQKNSQDSVRVIDEPALPMAYRRIEVRIGGVLWETILSYLPQDLERSLAACVQETRPDCEAIKAAVSRHEEVAGAEVRRGSHLRVA